MKKFLISLSPFHNKHAREEFVVSRRSSQTVANMDGQVGSIRTPSGQPNNDSDSQISDLWSQRRDFNGGGSCDDTW